MWLDSPKGHTIEERKNEKTEKEKTERKEEGGRKWKKDGHVTFGCCCFFFSLSLSVCKLLMWQWCPSVLEISVSCWGEARWSSLSLVDGQSRKKKRRKKGKQGKKKGLFVPRRSSQRAPRSGLFREGLALTRSPSILCDPKTRMNQVVAQRILKFKVFCFVLQKCLHEEQKSIQKLCLQREQNRWNRIHQVQKWNLPMRYAHRG